MLTYSLSVRLSEAVLVGKVFQARAPFPGAGHDGHLQGERSLRRKALSMLLLLRWHDLHGAEKL